MTDQNLEALIKELHQTIQDMKEPAPTQGNKDFNIKRAEKIANQMSMMVTGHGTGND